MNRFTPFEFDVLPVSKGQHSGSVEHNPVSQYIIWLINYLKAVVDSLFVTRLC